MDQKNAEQRGIRILNDIRMFFTPTKQIYSKYVERINMWKKMGEGERASISKAGLVTLLDIEWKELDHGSLVEFFNIFVFKRYEIYFEIEGIVYVVNK